MSFTESLIVPTIPSTSNNSIILIVVVTVILLLILLISLAVVLSCLWYYRCTSRKKKFSLSVYTSTVSSLKNETLELKEKFTYKGSEEGIIVISKVSYNY